MVSFSSDSDKVYFSQVWEARKPQRLGLNPSWQEALTRAKIKVLLQRWELVVLFLNGIALKYCLKLFCIKRFAFGWEAEVKFTPRGSVDHSEDRIIKLDTGKPRSQKSGFFDLCFNSVGYLWPWQSSERQLKNIFSCTSLKILRYTVAEVF